MMRNVEIYFDDPFEKRSISDEDLRAYSELHGELLTTDGRFEALAAKTKRLHRSYFEAERTDHPEALRTQLTRQLTKNILTVALEVADGSDAEKLDALRLFPHHLLETKGRFGIRGAETDLEVLNVMSPTMAALPKRISEANEERSTSLSS